MPLALATMTAPFATRLPLLRKLQPTQLPLLLLWMLLLLLLLLLPLPLPLPLLASAAASAAVRAAPSSCKNDTVNVLQRFVERLTRHLYLLPVPIHNDLAKSKEHAGNFQARHVLYS